MTISLDEIEAAGPAPKPEKPKVPQGSNLLGKVSHLHECIINDLCADPTLTQVEICKKYGLSTRWMSKIAVSDSFQARLAQRRDELLYPDLKEKINRRMKDVVLQSMNRIQEELDSPKATAEFALQSLIVAQTALGIGKIKPGRKT